MADLSDSEKLLIYLLSGDLGDSPTPYAALAAQTGLTEEEVLAAIGRFQADGLIRRFGATLWHQKSGFAANAMLVWRVEGEKGVICGEKMAALPYVSHCYLRRTLPGWPYNLYTMIHAEDRAGLSAMIDEMAALADGAEWRMLESLRELKKASLRYFPPSSTG
ncbi:Lrp/AsnC family transcriptional regulator [Deltaproteobacteria bacterium Smac51]|nr:Lrp/AsnC family transcriptional regulator [Deltaproteobacteria bacterium Smac51]